MNIGFALLLTVATAAVPPDPSTFTSGRENDLGLSFSPDGKTAFWAAWDGAWAKPATSLRTVFTSTLRNGRWSQPEVAPFSGRHNDDDPFVSPDGAWIYFISDRPVEANGANDPANQGDIWRYHLSGDLPAERLAVNSPAAEYSPVITADGHLYFSSMREGGLGQGDLYRAAALGDGFGTPENLGPAINSEYGEWNLWVSPGETELVFEASSRPSNVSIPGDLYYSWKTAAGWVPAVPLPSLNSGNSELMPRLHPAGETLYYGIGVFGGHARIEHVDWKELSAAVRDNFAPPLLVANRSSHEVTEVSAQDGQISRRYATGAGPHLLSNVENGKVLASGYGEFPRPHDEPVSQRPPFQQELNSRLTLIDAANGTIEWEVHLDDCIQPHASWLVGDRGYVSCEDERQILEVALATGSETRRFNTDQNGSHVLAHDPKSGLLSVSNTDSGSITLIDLETGNASVIKLAAGSEGALAHAGRIWVANGMDGSVSVVDPVTKREIRRVENVCGFPIAMSANDEGPVWLACFASSELIAISTDDHVIERRLSVEGQPLNLLLHPHLNLAYVALPRANAVAEIDLSTGNTLRSIPVGIEPDGLRWLDTARR